MKIETSSKAAEIGALIKAALDADERLQTAIRDRDAFHDKHRRLEAGIKALQNDLGKTEEAIEADRLSLVDAGGDVLKLNKRISSNLALLETTRESIEAMTAQVEGMSREMRYADEAIGSALTTIVNRQFFDGFQAQVTAIVAQAVELLTGYNQACAAAIVERNGRTSPSYRPHRVVLGDGIDLQQHIGHPVHEMRSIPAAPTTPGGPAYTPPALAVGVGGVGRRLGSFRR